jgi:hypothetical protein
MGETIDVMRDARRRKLESLYGHYLSLLTYEGNLVATRFSHTVATQTIFFGSYFVVTTSQYLTADVKHLVQIMISLCAIGFLTVYALILARTAIAATAWRASLSLIEQDDDFWYPCHPADFADLDIFNARSRAARGVETRQQHVLHAVTSTRFRLILLMSKLVRDPADFYAIYFPAIFAVVWAIFLATSISHVALSVANPPVRPPLADSKPPIVNTVPAPPAKTR